MGLGEEGGGGGERHEMEQFVVRHRLRRKTWEEILLSLFRRCDKNNLNSERAHKDNHT